MKREWKGPTLNQIADEADVSISTVDRVINGRYGVKESTRKRVENALRRLGNSINLEKDSDIKILFIMEAGSEFLKAIEHEARKIINNYAGIKFSFYSTINIQFNSERFATLIEEKSTSCHAIILVCRDDLRVNRAVREAEANGTTIICLTSDLPNSKRTAYVGVNQVSAGATAGWLMGKFLPNQQGNILLLFSSNYRTQEEREIGFRRVVRSQFKHLEIVDKMNMNDEIDGAYSSVKGILSGNKKISGIYNMAGGNEGVVKTLREHQKSKEITFIGHELSDSTRNFLEMDEMDAVMGHDLKNEIVTCIDIIKNKYNGLSVDSIYIPPIIHHKYFLFN